MENTWGQRDTVESICRAGPSLPLAPVLLAQKQFWNNRELNPILPSGQQTRTTPWLSYHRCPGHLGDPGVGHCYIDDEEEDGEDPVKYSYEHDPAKRRDPEVLGSSDKCPDQQSQNLYMVEAAEKGGKRRK